MMLGCCPYRIRISISSEGSLLILSMIWDKSSSFKSSSVWQQHLKNHSKYNDLETSCYTMALVAKSVLPSPGHLSTQNVCHIFDIYSSFLFNLCQKHWLKISTIHTLLLIKLFTQNVHTCFWVKVKHYTSLCGIFILVHNTNMNIPHRSPALLGWLFLIAKKTFLNGRSLKTNCGII